MAVRPLSLFHFQAAASTPLELVCRFASSELPRRTAKMAEEVARQPRLTNSARFTAALAGVAKSSVLYPGDAASPVALREFAARLRGCVDDASTELSHLVDVQRGNVLELQRCGAAGPLASLSETLDSLQYDLIGARTLSSFVADRSDGRAGAVRSVNPGELARDTADAVRAFAVEKFGAAPDVVVDEPSFARGAGRAPLSCLVVPEYLRFALVELLKNAVAASVEHYGAAALDDAPPVRVSVSGDATHVGLCVSDAAGGTAGRPGAAIAPFPYFSSTAPPPVQDSYHYSRTHGAPFSGLGLGLPRASLYARHLGGALALVSQPGRGVDAHLFVDRSGTRARDVWL